MREPRAERASELRRNASYSLEGDVSVENLRGTFCLGHLHRSIRTDRRRIVDVVRGSMQGYLHTTHTTHTTHTARGGRYCGSGGLLAAAATRRYTRRGKRGGWGIGMRTNMRSQRWRTKWIGRSRAPPMHQRVWRWKHTCGRHASGWAGARRETCVNGIQCTWMAY